MEKNNYDYQDKQKTNKEQLIVLSNKTNLSVSGTQKIISLKPDLIQLDTNYGGLVITGTNLELVKLDNTTTRAEISGAVESIKFVTTKSKEPLLRKIFK
ncbi:MAG: hypothetical protein E7351_00535 [Clostridiales bacterium]|nr:hypothetical protein [Clostridiales bacterium]